MGKFISLGEYNKLYKYIWIYLAIKFVVLFVFDYRLVFDQLQNEPLKLPSSLFIAFWFLCITFIIISFISTKYQNHHQKKTAEKDSIEEKKLIFNEINIIQEYGIEEGDYFLYVNLFFVVVADI